MTGHNTDPLTVAEPLDVWAEKLIDRALAKHANSCKLRERVEKLEVKLSTLIGFMAGSGLLGGVTGAAIARWMGA